MILSLVFSFIAFADSPHLTVRDYLDQVAGKSPLITAAKLHSEGGIYRAQADSVLTFPYLFGTLSSYDDQALPSAPAVQGTETKATAYTLGAGINSDFGLNAKYSWNSGYSEVLNIAFPSIGAYTSYNKIDLTLNMARNGFGSEISAKKQLIRAGNSAQALAGDYERVGTMAQAEGAYWRLAFARQAVAVQKDVIARASKLLDWAKRRVGLQLGDRSDVLQAQASFDLHNLDLSSALEDERAAARAFNVLRRQEGEKVGEAVAILSLDETLRMPAPPREGERLDVQAATEKTKAVQAQSQLDKEQLKPNVDLVASYAWNARKTTRSDAISNGFNGDHPTKAIALNFSVPLDVPTWKKAIQGADQEIEAASYELEQTKLLESRDWNDLSAHLDDSRERLKLLSTVENVQRDKFENERQRLLRGRTTTYQALTFEQDYASSQLLRLRTQADVLQTLAQMRSFRGKSE